MTPSMWFTAVVVPTLLSIGALVAYKVHERWLDRELARERMERGRKP